MKTSQQTEINQHPKQRGCRFWIVLFTLLLGFSPLLFYYGYCWGLWGRSSLLLQYLFQCNCPPMSEEARYPKQVEIIISACRNINVSTRLPPSGRFLYVYDGYQEPALTYLLNLQTMERINVVHQSFSSFLTDDLWFAESGLEDDIIDRKTGIQYPIKTFRFWQENAYVNGEPNLEMLISALRQAERVFLTQNNDTVVVLVSDFQTNLEQNFTFGPPDIPGLNPNRVEQFLQENNITYQTIPKNFREEAISPDGRFVARIDGIYEIETGQKIVNGYSIGGFFNPFSGKYLEVRGWTNDGSGVIYSKFLNPCVVEMGMMGGSIACFGEVPQPVIKLRVPEEYLLPTETP